MKARWIKSPLYDLVFILSPPFICLLLIFLFPSFFAATEIQSEWLWFFLIVGIDVGHVYSTIYRTYFDKEIIRKNPTLFFLSPVLIYITGVMLHSVNPLLFWRAMAYLAVFHFIRQQYGFLRLYTRNEKESVSKRMDAVMIYSSTLYPLLYWHFEGQQSFNWFIDNDFIYLNFPGAIPILTALYLIIISIYFIKEVYVFFIYKSFNLPKNVLIVGTTLSWYFGIVYFKGDVTFTLLNVVSHGVPYYALVWAYGNNKSKNAVSVRNTTVLDRIFKPVNLIFFIGILLVFAYMEETIWDGLVWKEHLKVFPLSLKLPDISSNHLIMSFLIPLFSLPQLFHYFIDGFIWKIKDDSFNWSLFLK